MKYKLTKNKKISAFGTLFQIQATSNFGRIKKGKLGGWISKEENLSQEGNCWVSDNACVYGEAQVSDNARISKNAQVCDNARISGNACVSGNALVSGNTYVSGNAKILDHAWVSGNARVYGEAQVCDNARVYDHAVISDNASISGNVIVSGNALVFTNIKLISGFFFGSIYKNEEINSKKIHENSYLLYTGEVKFKENKKIIKPTKLKRRK